MRHFTVEDVAEQLGVTKQAVSKYETGRAVPSADILRRIVEIFSLPTEYLTKEAILPENMSVVFYRKNNRTACREIEEAGILLQWYYEMIMASRGCCEKRELNIPHFPNDMCIEEKARRLRHFWHIGERPIHDMPALLEQNGFYVFTNKLTNEKIDGYSRFIGDCPIIVLNENKGNNERKNFSLAHELGHLLFHADADFDESEVLEQEADQFATCFLMPGESFSRGVIRKDADTLIELGSIWHVSPQAVLERCAGLGLLGDDKETVGAHKAYLYRCLSKRKNYFIPERKNICSLKTILEKIDSDETARADFMRRLCLPVSEIQRLCQMPGIFENYEIKETEKAEDLDGVQLSFSF